MDTGLGNITLSCTEDRKIKAESFSCARTFQANLIALSRYVACSNRTSPSCHRLVPSSTKLNRCRPCSNLSLKRRYNSDKKVELKIQRKLASVSTDFGDHVVNQLHRLNHTTEPYNKRYARSSPLPFPQFCQLLLHTIVWTTLEYCTNNSKWSISCLMSMLHNIYSHILILVTKQQQTYWQYQWWRYAYYYTESAYNGHNCYLHGYCFLNLENTANCTVDIKLYISKQFLELGPAVIEIFHFYAEFHQWASNFNWVVKT